MVNHVLSMMMQTGDRGLPSALQANDPSAFEGGEGALLRCVEELVTCIRISERDTLARLICRCGRAGGGWVGGWVCVYVCVCVWMSPGGGGGGALVKSRFGEEASPLPTPTCA